MCVYVCARACEGATSKRLSNGAASAGRGRSLAEPLRRMGHTLDARDDAAALGLIESNVHQTTMDPKRHGTLQQAPRQ